MIWLVPAAWLGALALAAPIVIHLVARPRAAVQPFPTLRFLPDTARASRRRHQLDDLPLLAVRGAIVVAAVAALAGPLVVTAARRAAWNARLVKETVDAADGPVSHGLARAVAALADAPPGRRAILVRSSFAIGSITDADVAAVPSSIGLTFERTATLPPRRDIDAPPVQIRAAETSRSGVLSRRLVVDGGRSSVRDGETTSAPAIDVVVPPDARATLDAVLAERVPAVPAGRRARLMIVGAASFVSEAREATPVRTAWIADAIARIARDPDLLASARRLTARLPADGFDREPWHVVAENGDGRPLAAASADAAGRLIVASASGPDQLATAVLLRSMLDAMAPAASFESAEVIAIADAQLRAWSREPGQAAAPRRETIDEDDRRALWIAVLILLGVETWMRRGAR